MDGRGGGRQGPAAAGRGGKAPAKGGAKGGIRALATPGPAAAAKAGGKLGVQRGGAVAKRGRGGRGGKGAAAATAGAAGGAGDGLEEQEPALACRGWFTKDLRIMMYGYGDHACPLDDTVDLVEDIVVEYMKEMTVRASEAAAEALKPRIDEKELLFLVRKEPAKFGRIKDLLAMNQVIKDARNSFKEPAAEEAEEPE